MWKSDPLVLSIGIVLATVSAIEPVRAEEAEPTNSIAVAADYVHDLVGVADGLQTGVKRTDLLSLTADLSLNHLVGWKGGNAHFKVIAGSGQQPNALAGTMQGINNVEVSNNRVRLFEAYLEQDLPKLRASLRLGFSDLNSEFYSNEAAGLLIAPAFGIGSELSATGSNGPAIFPSTAATVRLKVEPNETSYVLLAAVNAESGVLGDKGGVRPLFRNGALLIGEAGITGKFKLAFGLWNYTRAQDDIRLTTPSGDPVSTRARGGYMLAEGPVFSDNLTGFLRAGISDGNTTPYSGGWQAGFLVSRVLRGRPDSQLSFGVDQAYLTDKSRANAADVGETLGHSEIGAEVTYSDRLAPWLTIQPDIQYVWLPSRTAGSGNATILTLRLRIDPAGFSAF